MNPANCLVTFRGYCRRSRGVKARERSGGEPTSASLSASIVIERVARRSRGMRARRGARTWGSRARGRPGCRAGPLGASGRVVARTRPWPRGGCRDARGSEERGSGRARAHARPRRSLRSSSQESELAAERAAPMRERPRVGALPRRPARPGRLPREGRRRGRAGRPAAGRPAAHPMARPRRRRAATATRARGRLEHAVEDEDVGDRARPARPREAREGPTTTRTPCGLRARAPRRCASSPTSLRRRRPGDTTRARPGRARYAWPTNATRAPRSRELARARDGERRLARAAERRAADGDDADAFRYATSARRSSAPRPCPTRRERARASAPAGSAPSSRLAATNSILPARIIERPARSFKPRYPRSPLMLAVDPLRLARRQLELDRERTARFPHLLEHKAERMIASPLALAARRRAALLRAARARTRRSPRVRAARAGSWATVTSRTSAPSAPARSSVKETTRRRDAEKIVFDLNDFDDAFVGPWRFDVLRLTTSLILGGRELGLDGAAHARPVRRAARRVRRARRSTARRLPRRAASRDGARRHRCARARARSCSTRAPPWSATSGASCAGPRYETLPQKLRAKAERAFAKYVKRLPDAERPPAEALEVIDAAFRVAGTGSLGCLRVARARARQGRRRRRVDLRHEGGGHPVGRLPREAPEARGRPSASPPASGRASRTRRA